MDIYPDLPRHVGHPAANSQHTFETQTILRALHIYGLHL